MITVFTPAYNRAYIIEKLYQSLLQQTNFDFEWIVVDDGSTDNTEEIFANIKKNDNPFNIIYIKQENGGKHRAINRGVQIARGDLFFIVDSDDYVTNDAIEKLCKWKDSLDNSKKWAGVSGLRGYENGSPIGGVGKKNHYIDARDTERLKYHLGGDKAEAYFTEILKKYPFPEFEGENFITEAVVWHAIARDGYYIRWFPEIIYICEYLQDGLTKNNTQICKRNPQGMLYWAKQELQLFPKNIKQKLIAINGYCEAVKDTKGINEVAKDLGVSRLSCKIAMLAAKIKRKFKK